ncbi:MAG: phosphoribosyltransferase [Cuniculiplasma sp.]|nr:phosphoribosyltransferase [Cuniculiplasma sp.]
MEFKAKLVTWDDIEKWCEEINKKMLKDGIPDAIIGLSRGGLVPARILSDMILMKNLYAIKTEHWGLTATVDGKADLKYGLNVSIEGKNVLVVDDITDTGQSMKLAYDYIKTLKPKSVKTSTMLHIGHSSFVPDYYAQFVTDKEWTWFIFPWNVYEDITNLSSKIEMKSNSVEEIRKKLEESFDLSVKNSVLEKVLMQMVHMGKAELKDGKYTYIQA